MHETKLIIFSMEDILIFLTLSFEKLIEQKWTSVMRDNECKTRYELILKAICP